MASTRSRALPGLAQSLHLLRSFAVSFAMDSCVCSSSRSCHLSVFRWTPPPVSRGRASAERVRGAARARRGFPACARRWAGGR